MVHGIFIKTTDTDRNFQLKLESVSQLDLVNRLMNNISNNFLKDVALMTTNALVFLYPPACFS